MTDTLAAYNLISREDYSIRMETSNCPFLAGAIVFGSLIQWRGEWYWSGEQRIVKDLTEAEQEELRNDMLQGQPELALRYCPKELAEAQEANRKTFEKFLRSNGDDLAILPDGEKLGALRLVRLDKGVPSMEPGWAEGTGAQQRPPAEVLASSLPWKDPNLVGGIALFSSAERGLEVCPGINLIISALKKKGASLSVSEREALERLMVDPTISPAFVRRLAREYGQESWLSAYQLGHLPVEQALAFLLRCHKGHFYRPYYPSLYGGRGETPTI